MHYFCIDSWGLMIGGLDAGKDIAALGNICSYGPVFIIVPFYE
jgi:hypothetical protein